MGAEHVRPSRLIAALLLMVGLVAATLAPAGAEVANSDEVTVVGLTVEHLVEPVGLDAERPRLAWRLDGGDRRGVLQTAYQVQVWSGGSSADNPLWDSGRVDNDASTAVVYDGPALESSTGYHWRVRVWDESGEASRWSEPSLWETALLRKEDWAGADWITQPEEQPELTQLAEVVGQEPPAHAEVDRPHVTIDVGATEGRYVRLEVTHLGEEAVGEALPVAHRLQLAELQVVDTAAGLQRAEGGPVAASESLEVRGAWSTTYLNDGKVHSDSNPRGYSSQHRETPDIADDPIWVEIDLGQVVAFDQVRLFPRTDATTSEGGIPNFPVDYTIASRDDPTGGFTQLAEVVGQEPPAPAEVDRPHVTIDVGATEGRYVRLEVTHLGEEAVGERLPVAHRLQLAELQVVDTAAGLQRAEGGPVAASESLEVRGAWSTTYLNDGKVHSDSNPRGYSSQHRETPDIADDPIWVEIDLGQVVAFDQVRLFPRTDATTSEGGIPNFPVDYTIGTRDHRPEDQEPLFARDFELDGDIERARLYLSGLGLHEARLNGEKVGDAVLEPGETEFETTVQYVTYDVTDDLVVGKNTLGVMLGNGIYNVPYTPGRYQKLTRSSGPLQLIGQLRIDYADGRRETVGTDDQWRVGDGPITFSAWYGGEDYDARLEQDGWDQPGFDRAEWGVVELAEGPGGDLRARRDPPIQVVETIPAVSVEEVAPDVHLVDFGQNFAGWPEMTVEGDAGTSVALWPAEQLDADGRINQNSTGAPIWSTYTLAGSREPEVWHPRFSYHGFRYLEVRGHPGEPQPEDFRGLRLRTANPRSGEFTTSNELLQGIDSIIDASIQSNMYSTLTDCPHREKLGWLEVSQLMFTSIASGYDVAAWYEKLFDDMSAAQLDDGMVPTTAPEYLLTRGNFRDSPNWGGAIVMGPWYHYLEYGDTAALQEHFPAMVSWIDYLGSRAKGHLLSHGLGDWGAVDRSTPRSLVETAAYYEQVSTMARIAETIGDSAAAGDYATLAADIRAAFIDAFYDASTATYSSGSQASLALPLYLGLVPEGDEDRVLDSLVAAVAEADGHFTTGEIGLRPLIRALTDNGRADVVYEFATKTDHPSYGYQLEHGATSLSEWWDGPTSPKGQNSLNHLMLGHIQEWFYRDLAGLRPAAPGWAEIEINPTVPADLDDASARIETVRGEAAASWEKTGRNGLLLQVTVPANATATVYVPVTQDQTVRGGEPAKAVELLRVEDDRHVYSVGSGTYTFEVRDRGQ